MSIFLFINSTLLSLLLFYLGTGKDKSLLIKFALWQILVGLIISGMIFQIKPIALPAIIFLSFLFLIIISKKIKIAQIKPQYLILIHTIRIPVELGLYSLYLDKKVPIIMTFEGWNYDILFAISAFTMWFIIYVLKFTINKKIIMAWNIIGLIFVAIIVTIAILASPLPIQQLAFDQPNVAVLELPFCFLPTCIVPLVVVSHVMSLKHLMRK